MSVKTDYFKMDKKDFENHLNQLKQREDCVHLLDDKFFYCPSSNTMNQIIELNKQIQDLDSLIKSFTEFVQKQIVQSFLISEIEATNKIENINSTRHDIFYVISNATASKDKKVISIGNTYKELMSSKGRRIETLTDIRELYDSVMKDAIEKDDTPDGVFFRKNPVFVTNGIKAIHTGVSKEEDIDRYMNEFIRLYNSDMEIFTKMILSHYLFEYVHPFYDGNGRFGRFLFSNGLYLYTNSYVSFLISSSFANHKSKYYKAFQQAEDRYEFECLNEYVSTILEILSDEIEATVKTLKSNKEKIDSMECSSSMTKSERKIYRLICEATVFSEFGVSNEEIMKEMGISKRTLMYSLLDLKNRNEIEDIKVGKYCFHKAV